MTALDTGTYGAKRQSWRRSNPRDLLVSIIDANPSAPEATILKSFEDAVSSDLDMLAVVVEYWFANNYRSLVRKPPANKSAQKRAESAVTKLIKARAVQMVLLDMTMPNGKPLKDCTGNDCARAGGWLAKIAQKIKPTERVGQVLSEKQVRSLYQNT